MKPTFEAVREMGQPAVAETDHGNVFGAYDFVTTAQEMGVKPIVGMEAYIAPGSRFAQKKEPLYGLTKAIPYTHMTLLSENNEGMANLFRVSSLAAIEGLFGTHPRADKELISQYSKGLIGTTGCLSGELKTLLKAGEFNKARSATGEWAEIFGKDNFFVEVMDHGIKEEQEMTPQLLQIAKDLNLPLLATNDSHYTYEDQAKYQDALLCINTGSHIHDEKRMRFDGGGYHMKTSAQMRELFPDDLFPGACDNTLWIADRCDVSFSHRDDIVPKFDVPEGETEETWFRKETERGLHMRYGAVLPQEVVERAKYEMDIICNMGFPGYFLVVSDFIRWGKERRILFGPGRGSGAGSIVAYAMQITELDPLEHKLLFERFLNPERVSMPDFDVDIQDDRRGEVIEYVTQKYGSDKVSQIITYGTLKGKAALKDSTRILGHPIDLGNKLSEAYPEAQQGKEAPLEAIWNKSHPRYKDASDLRNMYESDKNVHEIVDIAQGIEGLTRGWGIHAAGVVICEEPLLDVIPLYKRRGNPMPVTQFDMEVCEKLGLLKMDFLGLVALRVIQHTIDSIEKNSGKKIEALDLPMDDPATFEMLARGDTLGVFQLDGTDMRNLLRRMKPDSFEDISAVLALYRPGPMGANAHTSYADRKNGREHVEYIHPELSEALRPALESTFGLIVYQEQVMQIAQDVAGYSLGQADILRRAMGKKKKSELDKQKAEFRKGVLDHGFSEQAFNTLWETLLPFADYAFNRAHAASYGLVSYWEAYLKANYPTEYLAALLSTVDDRDKAAVYLNECRRLGINISAPDINKSDMEYTPTDNEIAFGLTAVKGVGPGPVSNILKARKDRPFTTLSDFCYRTRISKMTLNPLIKTGALDSLGYSRKGMVEMGEPIIDTVVPRGKDEDEGIYDIFSLLQDDDTPLSDPPIPDDEFSSQEILEMEYALSGMYFSGHPLDGYLKYIDSLSSHDWLEVSHLKNKTAVVVGGLLKNVTKKISKRGNPWATMDLVGREGAFDMRCFAKEVLEKKGDLLQDGNMVMVKTRVDKPDTDEDGQGQVTLIVEDIKPVTKSDEDLKDSETVRLQVSEKALTREAAVTINRLLAQNRGQSEFSIQVSETGKIISFPNRIRQNPGLKRSLIKLFGRHCILKGFGEG